jgi:transcriptional regulator with XRE-family HTH domain
MKLDAALRVARATKRLKQWQIAEKLGVTQQAVSDWENGGWVAEEHWEAIKEELGVDIASFPKPVKSISTTITRSTLSNSPAINANTCGSISINTPPLPGDKHTLALTPQEHEAITLFRRFGNPNLLEKCIQKLKQAEAIFG